MNDMIAPEWYARLRQAFLLGTNRQPLPSPPGFSAALAPGCDPALVLAALAGQRLRFAGATGLVADPLPEAAQHLHTDPRPLLPAAARTPLLHLAEHAAPELVALAIRRIAGKGMKLHPFDLPVLKRHLKTNIDDLGMTERAYLSLSSPSSGEGGDAGHFFDRITLDNWTTFPRARRRDFVAEIRREDAAAGRALVESVWTSEPAPVRVMLLAALGVGLGPDDKQFLDGLAVDRAKSVKDLAASLMARMPQSEGFAERVAEAAECFSRTSSTLGRALAALGGTRRETLRFSIGAGAGKSPSDWQELQARRERLFSGMPLGAIAAQVGATAEEIVAALPDEEMQIALSFIETALGEGDKDLAQMIVRSRLLSASTLSAHMLAALAQQAPAALDPDTAQRLIASQAWSDAVRGLAHATAPSAHGDDGRLAYMAALMPRQTTPAFVETLSPLALGTARNAKDFSDLVLALPD